MRPRGSWMWLAFEACALVACTACGASALATPTTVTAPSPAWQTFAGRAGDDEPPVTPHTERTERALASLPLAYDVAYRELYALGHPTLEGAELREVDVWIEDAEGRRGVVRMRAFVVAGPRGPWAFATGVWRRVLGMGPPLDVVADCELAVAERARAREADREALERSRVAAGEPSDENDRALEDRTRALWREAERRCPRWDSVLPLALRGRADLAHALLGPPPPRTEQTARRLMFEWLLDLTHELSLAYHAGRDDDARRHGAIVSRVLDASGVWRASWGGEPILAELARREGPRLAPLRGDAPIAAETTAELIGLLDELAVVQPEPSGRSWREPPSSHVLRDTSLVRALAARGPEATDALLDCASNDRRLSRSLRHSSPWVVRSFSFVPVRELCALALEPRFEDSRSRLLLEEMLWMYGPDLEWQTRALAEARTATRGLSEAEIVLRFLSDDEAAQWQWANAARWMREDPDGDGPAPENAASLRGRDDARLTQLLARRARQLADDEDDTRALCQVLEAALAWDDAAAELLAAEIASCRADDDCVCGETLGAP